MAIELSLEEGINKAIFVIERATSRPVLVAIYGTGDAGKTYLIDKLGDYFKSRGKSVAKMGGAPHADLFLDLRDIFADEPEALNAIYLFHCGWDRQADLFSEEDPNFLADGILDRELDLNIGVYNPSHTGSLRGDYDFVIKNPGSVRKKTFDSYFRTKNFK
ncbi:MAG: hypothetical protein V1645_02660 [archaeon]